MARRVLNRWTLLGLVAPVMLVVLLSLATERFHLDALLIYFAAPFVLSFLAFRLLPWRGARTLLITVPLVGWSWFGLWFGGIGIGVGLLAALSLPNECPNK